TGLAQRVKDRLNGMDRVSETPREVVIASKRVEDSKPAEKVLPAKKEETKSADLVASSKQEPPKPAEVVDWHKSWGAEVKPKTSEAVAQLPDSKPSSHQVNHVHSGRTKSVEVGKQ